MLMTHCMLDPFSRAEKHAQLHALQQDFAVLRVLRLRLLLVRLEHNMNHMICLLSRAWISWLAVSMDSIQRGLSEAMFKGEIVCRLITTCLQFQVAWNTPLVGNNVGTHVGLCSLITLLEKSSISVNSQTMPPRLS